MHSHRSGINALPRCELHAVEPVVQGLRIRQKDKLATSCMLVESRQLIAIMSSACAATCSDVSILPCVVLLLTRRRQLQPHAHACHTHSHAAPCTPQVRGRKVRSSTAQGSSTTSSLCSSTSSLCSSSTSGVVVCSRDVYQRLWLLQVPGTSSCGGVHWQVQVRPWSFQKRGLLHAGRQAVRQKGTAFYCRACGL